MAWNQPGDDNNKPAPRGGPDVSPLVDTLRRWQRRLRLLLRPGGHGAAAAAGLLLLIAVVWLASGFYEIESAERGVVQRFGRYIGTEEPGRGWHWPWPIETVTKVNVGALSSIDSKSMMLTADLNLLNVGWTVQYQLRDPLQFLFQLRDPEATLRQSAASAMRQLIGRTAMDTVLSGEGRRRITADARVALQKTLDGYNAGISVTNVNLTDLQVPDAVLSAQRDVSKAEEDASRATQEAQAYANDIVPKAQSSAQRQLQEAESYKAQVTAVAEGDAQRFTQLAAAYGQAPEVTRNRLYLETVESVLARSRKVIVDTKSGGGNMIYLSLDKLLEATRASNASPTSASTAASAANTAGANNVSNGTSSAGTPAARPAIAGSSDAAPADTSLDGSEARSRERVER